MRIIVASGERAIRSSLALLISAQPDFELVGDALDFEEIADLLERIKDQPPELVVLDWDGFGQRIVELQKLFDRRDPPTVIALSVDDRARTAALASGVAGFAYKGDSPTRLLELIRLHAKDVSIRNDAESLSE